MATNEFLNNDPTCTETRRQHQQRKTGYLQYITMMLNVLTGETLNKRFSLV